MALTDGGPIESPLGMAVANNALLAALIGALIDQKVITGLQLMNAITAARRDVNRVQNNPPYRDADLILATLQKRFPVA